MKHPLLIKLTKIKHKEQILKAVREKQKRIKRHEDNLKDLQGNMKHCNIIEVPEEEDKKERP